jgi:Type II secretion system (T2SS), protein F
MPATIDTGKRAQIYLAFADAMQSGESLAKTAEGLWQIYGQEKSLFPQWLPMRGDWLRMVAAALKRGLSAQEAVKNLSTPLESLLIGAAERTGNIVTGFQAAAAYLDSLRRLKETMQSQLTEPVASFQLSIAIAWYTASSTLEQLGELSVNNGQLPPQMAQAFGQLEMVRNLALGVECVVVSWVLLFLLTRRKLAIKARIWLDRLPLFSAYRRYMGAQILHLIVHLTKSSVHATEGEGGLGLHFVKAVREVQTAVASPWLNLYLNPLQRRLAQGRALPEALMDIGGHFPDPELVKRLKPYVGNARFDDRAPEIIARLLDEQLVRLKNVAAKTKTMVDCFNVGMTVFIFYSINQVTQSIQSAIN